MKTLLKLFHKDLIKNWFFITLISASSCYLYFLFEGYEKSSIFSVVKVISIIIASLAPIAIFAVNNHFKRNIHWLINLNFNRKELIQFHFLSQTIRIALFALTILALYIVVAINTPVPEKQKPFEYFSYADFFTYYVALIFILMLLYAVPLFVINKDAIQRSKMINKKTLRKRILSVILGIILAGIVIIIIETSNIPMVVIVSIVAAFVGASSVNIFSRSFRIFTTNKEFKVMFLVAGISLIPFLLFILLMKNEVHNSSLNYKERIDSVLLLDNLNNNYSEKEKIGFLMAADNRNELSDLLSLYGKSLKQDQIFKAINTQRKMGSLADFYNEKLSESELQNIIDFIEEYKTKNKPTISYDYMFTRFFQRHKVSSNYIEKLVTSKSSIKKIIGLALATSSLKDDEFIKLYEKNKDSLSELLNADRYLTRHLERSRKKLKGQAK